MIELFSKDIKLTPQMEDLYYKQMQEVLSQEEPIAKIIGLVERKSGLFVGTASLFVEEPTSEKHE